MSTGHPHAAPDGAQALHDVRVLDLSRVLAGPWATQLLADLGAEVIKVERPHEGDDTRQWGPPFLHGAGDARAQSAYFLAANRGKRSICIDIASADGQHLIRQLALSCDVLVENFKVGALAAYGLDYESLRAVNPALIYCSITGFGQDGPYAERPGYDFLVQGMGGLMSITGRPDGEPLKVGVALADIITGLYAASGVLAALSQRSRTGVGQHIDVALLDSVVAALANQASSYLLTGEEPVRLGNAHPSIVPYDLFPTADGHIILAVGNDAQFRRCCAVLGCPELADDERFATNRQRVANRQALTGALTERLRRGSSARWLERLGAADVPAGPVSSIGEVFADPQVLHRRLRVEIADAAFGAIPVVACPLRLSASPPRYVRAPPALGEATREVLRDRLGLSEEGIEALYRRGIVA